MTELRKCKGTWAYCDGDCDKCTAPAPTADVVELEGSKVGKYLSYTTTGNPTADVREIVHAHWKIVYNEDCDGGGKYICGNCGHSFSFGAYFELCRFDYCPNCGAQMDERRE